MDGNKIQIGLGMSTMMACPPPIMDQEAAYLANLQAAASYKIADDQLTFANAKGSTVLTFKAEIPISLTDGSLGADLAQQRQRRGGLRGCGR